MAKKPVAKAVETPRGSATSMVPVSPYQVAVQVSYSQSRGIVQNTGADWFGPLNPMAPIAPPEVAGRRMDFLPGANLVTTPRSGDIGFPTLRALADSYDLVRLVIETRKDQLCKLKFKVRLKKDDNDADDAVASPEQAAAIAEITKLLKRPDGVNRWRPWLRSLLEDLFVIDAPTVYCQRNRGGKLISLKPIDGGTIKVVIDDWGRTPMPYMLEGKMIYPPAYQQVLKGFPAVNYSVRDIIYRPYNRRVHKIYGYSPVEQIIVTVNIALRRQAFTLAYYTEGNIPESLIGTPDSWTPEQVGAFQKMWDQMFTGNLAARRHAKFVPGGVAKTYIPTKEPDLKNPMDDWLARIVCFAFSVSPQQLVAMMNRATAVTSGDQAKEEGVEPVKEWVIELVNDIIETEWQRDDLEFAFDEEVEVDQEKQKDIVTAYVDSGILTINQGLEMLGSPPSPDPAADILMVKTATGYVPIDANTIEGKKAAIDAGISADPTIPPVLPGAGAFGAKPGGKGPPGKAGAPGKAPPGKVPAKPGAAPAKRPAAKHAAHALLTPAFSKAARRARRHAPIPFDRAKARAVVGSLAETVARALRKAGESAAKHVRAELGKARGSNIDLGSGEDRSLAKAAGEDEPRDDHGRWTAGGGSHAQSTSATLSSHERLATQAANERQKAGEVGYGNSAFALPDGSHVNVSVGPKQSNSRGSNRGGHRATTYVHTPAGAQYGKQTSRAKVEELMASHGYAKALGKASRRDPDEVARELAAEVDLSAIEEIVPDVGDELATVASDAGRLALAQIGPNEASGLVDQVNERAVAAARDMAAELVGMRYNGDGDLVPAVRPEYRIDDTTRDAIREIIADGLEENIGTDEIADNILESTAFSQDRADLIANTEVRRANSAGAVEGYQAAADAGVSVQKEWLPDVDPCPICQDNADEGPIDLDDEFSSGDDYPPAHPNCECAVSPVVVDESDSSSTDDEE